MKLWLMFAWLIDVDDLDAILGPLLVLGIIGAGIWYLIRRWRFRSASARWTMTDGVIESAFAANPASRSAASMISGHMGAVAASHLWKPVLQYSYQVTGEFYSGYVMLGEGFLSREAADSAAQPWLKKKIIVRYNPKKPHESAFLVSDGAPRGSRSLGDQPPASDELTPLSLK